MRFADNVKLLSQWNPVAVVEVGPGTVLCKLLSKSFSACSPDKGTPFPSPALLPCMRHPKNTTTRDLDVSWTANDWFCVYLKSYSCCTLILAGVRFAVGRIVADWSLARLEAIARDQVTHTKTSMTQNVNHWIRFNTNFRTQGQRLPRKSVLPGYAFMETSFW